MAKKLKWWEYPAAFGVAVIIVSMHTWKWIDDKLRKDGV